MEVRKQTHIPYGFVTAIAMIIIGVVLEVARLTYKPGVQWIGMAVFLVGVIMNAMAFSKANDANVTFGQVFGSGFKTTAIIAIVMFAWSFIVPMIFPDVYDKGLEKAREDMEKNPKLTEEQVEMAMNMTRKYFKPLLHAGALFGTLIGGLIFSLIGAAVAKKAPRQQKFDFQ